MSSVKLFAQCVTPETSCTRRSSLNQLELLKHISKLSISRSTNSQRSDKNVKCDWSFSLSCEGCSDLSCPEETDKDWTCQSDQPPEEYLSVRRASCGPQFMRPTSPLRQRPPLRRASFAVAAAGAATAVGRGTERPLLWDIKPVVAERRRSFGASSPILSGLKVPVQKVHRPSFQSLSPCVEDRPRESKFRFSPRAVEGETCIQSAPKFLFSPGAPENKTCTGSPRKCVFSSGSEDKSFASSCIFLPEVNGSWNSEFPTVISEEFCGPERKLSCSPFVCDIEKSLNRGQISESQGSKNEIRRQSKRKCSVPSIFVSKGSPDAEGEETTIHEGFSLWLINLTRDSSSKSITTNTPLCDAYQKSSRNACRSPYRSLCWNACRSLIFTSSIYSRRISLQNPNHCTLVAPRKTSLHVPRLRSSHPTGEYKQQHKRRRLCSYRQGSVLGRGGFGIVYVGRYRGSPVAVKKVIGSKGSQCLAGEEVGLAVPPHPHLVTTLAVVAPTSGGMATVHHRVDDDGGWKREISLNQAEVEFGLVSNILKPRSSNRGKQDDYLICSPEAKHSNRRLKKNSVDVEEWYPMEGHEDKRWQWVISELCTNTTLLSLILSTTHITIKQKLRFLGELASGLSFLHACRFIHRDVKPANALLAQAGTVKLGDFGCAADLRRPLTPVLGTIVYQAPEVLQGSGGCPLSDVYSFGVTAWHLLSRSTPYKGLHPHVIAYNVTRVCLRPDAPWPPGAPVMPAPARGCLLELMLGKLSRQCWQSKPTSRPTSASLCRSLAILYLTPELYTPETRKYP